MGERKRTANWKASCRLGKGVCGPCVVAELSTTACSSLWGGMWTPHSSLVSQACSLGQALEPLSSSFLSVTLRASHVRREKHLPRASHAL